MRFAGVRAAPKPTAGRVPVLPGGESDAALARAAAYGDGWYGFNLGPGEAAERIGVLRERLRARGREAQPFAIVVAPFTKPAAADDLRAYRDAVVDELVVVDTPPPDETKVAAWVQALAQRRVVPAAALG